MDSDSSDTGSSLHSLASSGLESANEDSSDVDFSSEDESEIEPLPFDESLVDEPDSSDQSKHIELTAIAYMYTFTSYK